MLLAALLVACTTTGELPPAEPVAAPPAEPPALAPSAEPPALAPPAEPPASPAGAAIPPAPAAQLHPATTTAELFGITGDDAGLILAVGGPGTILRSDDHGHTWHEPASPTLALLRAAWRSPGGTLFVAGGGGTILRSRDRGRTWEPRSSGTLVDLAHLAGNHGEVLVAGERGTILRSLDDGDTWTAVAMPTFPPEPAPARPPPRLPRPATAPPPPPSELELLRARHRPDADVIGLGAPRPGELWIALHHLLWQRPDERGEWRVVASTTGTRDRFAELWVGDTHWAVTGRNKPRERPDFFVGLGTTGGAGILLGWSAIDSRLISPPQVIGAPRVGLPPILYLAGDGYAVHWSEDGGLNWAGSEQSAVMQSPYPLAKRALWVAPDGTLLAAGRAGAVMRSRDRARTWTALNGAAREPLFGGALGPDGSIHTAVAFAVLRGRGGQWELLSPGARLPVGGDAQADTSRGLVQCCTDVWVAPDGTLLAAGSGRIWRSHDDGRTWKQAHASDPRQDCCWSLWGDERGVFGVDRDVVLASVDRGKTWTRTTIAGHLERDDPNRLDISGGGDHLLIVGGPGRILHSSDRGRSWARRASPTSEPLYAGLITPTATGLLALAVGEHGTLLRSTDAVRWQQVALPTRMRLLGAHRDPTRGELYLAGDAGLLRSQDDGLTWTLDPARHSLRSVFGDGRGLVYAAGDSGLVLRLP